MCLALARRLSIRPRPRVHRAKMHGVVPAWLERPRNTNSSRLCPAMVSTTTERPLHGLQNRALLDMKFHVAQNIVADGAMEALEDSTQNLRWPGARKSPGDLDARAVPCRICPTKARLPMNGVPKRAPSSSEKPTISIPNGSRFPVQAFEHCDSQHYPEYSIEGPGVGDRVEVRADSNRELRISAPA